MSIHHNLLSTVDNGDTITFKFKFASDAVGLPESDCLKDFTVKKTDALLEAEKSIFLTYLAELELEEIAKAEKAAKKLAKEEAKKAADSESEPPEKTEE